MATDPNPLIVPLARLDPTDAARAGAKAVALARLMQNGIDVPDGICLTTDAYDTFLDATGMRERIMLVLYRKRFEEMRWEEIWDCATRIRHMFTTQALPVEIRKRLLAAFDRRFGHTPVVVRSSAPEEDSANASFAGLHTSSVNVRGPETILEHVRIVWASLWSDAALLYRQELGLRVDKSAMAVIVQELAVGRCSGVAFSHHPLHPGHGLIEAVYGLNQGLVDGLIEPDRWEIDRDTDRIVSHAPAQRRHYVAAGAKGPVTKPLSPKQVESPPLTSEQVTSVYALTRRLEELFDCGQDVEWTLVDQTLNVVQSRPITTSSHVAADDQRSWYLSLHRSFDNLTELGQKIETQWIPEMIRTADDLARIDVAALSHQDLIAEIERRWQLNQHWTRIYWEDFIPFAHGMRLFGQIYNDKVKPADPYEFVDLLSNTPMLSVERNRQLAGLADMIRRDGNLAIQLADGLPDVFPPHPFYDALTRFIQSYGDLSCGITGADNCKEGAATLLNTVMQMARTPQTASVQARTDRLQQLQDRFTERFPPDQKQTALDLLSLARRSYRLRDDDNIYLGRIEAGLIAAVQEGRRRLSAAGHSAAEGSEKARLAEVIDRFGPSDGTQHHAGPVRTLTEPDIHPRQLTGQPAGPGVASGPARIIRSPRDLSTFKAGDILVCDAIDPNMTFLIPLAAGIVERRGGMLIHGAIIAREYGLPCITGVPRAVDRIRTGDRLTVDGYLGIVTVSRIDADRGFGRD